jgi:N-acyl-D-aspartate/D-glutamate deacylase
MGEQATEREATADETAQMKRLVGEALAAGALGFATSKSPTHVGYAGRPVPSRAAAKEEILALTSALGERGEGVIQATVGQGLFLDEMEEISRATGRPISWTALLADLFGATGHRQVLEKHSEMQRRGVAVYPQVACRPLTFEYQWKAPFPFESMRLFERVSAADFEGKKRIYADPEFRRAFREHGGKAVLGGTWQDTVVSECSSNPEMVGKSLSALADERGVHPTELALDLGLATNLEARFRVQIANKTEASVAELLTHPAVVLGLSDAGAHASQLCDACFSTHLLSHWVRERGVLTLEQAVRLLSARSAEIFGITDRGRLASGLAADVVVFDPDTIGCSPLRRVHDLPAGADRLVAEATGIRAVVVNGAVVRQNGADSVDGAGLLPGRLLRGGRAS